MAGLSLRNVMVAPGSHAWQIEERAHQRAEYVFKQFDHSELHKQTAYGAGDHTDAHKVEHGVEQQVMGGVHDSVEHVGEAMIDPTYQNRAKTTARQGTPVGIRRHSENERAGAGFSVFP